MAKKKLIVELGTGVDMHGGDCTKAAKRAVDDAIHHGSLLYIGEILKEGKPLEMYVDVTIAAPDPGSVDTEAVLEVLPFGERTIKVVAGGMAWGKEEDPLIVCNAAVEVSVES